MEVEGGFEAKIGHSWPLPVELGGRRLFALDTGRCHGYYSEDGGRTWGSPCEIRQEGSGMLSDGQGAPTGDVGLPAPLKGSITSVRRLSSGLLGALLVERRPEEAEQYRHNAGNGVLHTVFMTSEDEGRTWADPVPIGRPGESLLVANNSLTQLESGRLLAPLNWWVSDPYHPEYTGEGRGHPAKGGYGNYRGRRMLVEGHHHHPEFGGAVVFYSDDLGRTWRSGPNNLWVWPLPSEEGFGGHAPFDEPAVVETADGRILMFGRTVLGRVYRCVSADGGEHWSVPRPTELASSDSPCMVRRIPSTGDLVMVWNQLSAEEILRGLKRARMCTAISRDQGETWENFRTVEVCGGLPPAKKIEPPPIRTYHSFDDVGDIPVDFGVFAYPSIAFMDDMALFGYGVNEMRPVSEWPEDAPITGVREWYGKVKAVPLSWLYE